MFKSILRDIYNVDVWPAFSLVLFVTFFVAMLVWTFTRNRGYCTSLSHLPLGDDAGSEGDQA